MEYLGEFLIPIAAIILVFVVCCWDEIAVGGAFGKTVHQANAVRRGANP